VKKELKFLCPNGHLGFAPTKEGSFYLGVKENPDFILCDSGSDDIGPVPLGADISTSLKETQIHDLELMLVESRRLGIPMIVGSAGDTGTNSRVDMYVKFIAELAKKHRIPRFKIGYFYSEVEKEYVLTKMKNGEIIEGLDGRHPLSRDELEKTDRIVAVAGVHPYLKLLESGAEVIIGGRSSDCAIFAAPALHHGFSADLAYYLGKVLECASFCAEPYAGKESVLGMISENDVKVKAMHPHQRCTIASVAGHAMYERSNPYYEYVAGGMLDMSNCVYEQYDEKTCRITGSRFYPIEDKIKVKLEGSGKVGERFIGIAGIRDPYTIKNIDRVVEWARSQVRERFGEGGYELSYRIYGKNGVMGDLEPVKKIRSHELGIVVEGIAPTKEMARELTLIGTRQMFYARLPEVKGTAGAAAFVVDEVLEATPAYTWTMNHAVCVDDPLELFKTGIIEAGIEGRDSCADKKAG
jgi:hypothetical protein